MKKYIFVDFFDTIMFRKIHSFQLLPQWQKKIKSMYPELSEINLIKLRIEIIKKIGKIEYEIKYKDLIKEIYDRLVSDYDFSASYDEFYERSYRNELYIDYATQYPNKKIIKYIKKQYKLGSEIYIVSDYNLPKEAYDIYLKQYDLNYLFKGIFSSEGYGKSKHNGELYKIVIDKLNIDPKNVVMIGDSKHSDVDMALKVGIGRAKRYFPFMHKIYTNITRSLNRNFNKFGKKYVIKKSQKSELFLEYSIPLYYAISQMYNELLKMEYVKNVLFLSRGGYFLQDLFNEYQKNKNRKFNAVYFKNSRYVNERARKEPAQRDILAKYLNLYSDNGKIILVDEGWNCSTQLFFTNEYNYKTSGLYLGIFKNDYNENAIRKGVLFNVDSGGNKSKYYGIFRTNCTFYEQILTAPHGSLKGYILSEDKINFVEEWNEKEKKIYNNYTHNLQLKLKHSFNSIDAWNIEYNNKTIAHMLLKSLLFANKKRLRLLREYDLNYHDNMGVQKKAQQNIRDANISVKKLIIHPEDNMRYFCKVKEMFYSKRLRLLYYPIGVGMYFYLKFVLWIKKM